MHKKAGVLLVTLGAVLILSALLLALYNSREDKRAGQEAESLLVDVRDTISVVESEKELSPQMPVKEVDGFQYVGYLSIPALDRELPIQSDWDYEKLKASPCRHFGSSRTDDLVIAAHDYKRHFGDLDELKPGDAVTVTDMEGIENHYQVSRTDILEPTAVEEVKNSGHDLVLYTCTYTGATRFVVFCDRVEA